MNKKSTYAAVSSLLVLTGFVSPSAHGAEEDAIVVKRDSHKLFTPKAARDQLCPLVFKDLPKSISMQGVKQVRFSYDDRFLIVWGSERDCFAKVFSADGKCVLDIHGLPTLSGNRRVLAAAGTSKTRFWDLERWEQGPVFEDCVLLALSRDGQSALTSRVKEHPTLSRFLHLRDTLELVRCFQAGQRSFPLETKSKRKYVRAAGFSYHQDSILAVIDSEASNDSHVRYDVETGKVEEKVERPGWNGIGVGPSYFLSQPTPSDLVFSSTTRPYASSYGHSRWQTIANDSRMPRPKYTPDGGIGANRVVFSEDGQLFSVFGKNLGYGYRNDVVLGRRNEATYRFHFRRRPNFDQFNDLAVAFSRTAPIAAVAIDQDDGRLRLVRLDVNPNENPIQLLNCGDDTPRNSVIVDLDFSASGALLVGTDGKRNALRLWNVSQSAKEPANRKQQVP